MLNQFYSQYNLNSDDLFVAFDTKEVYRIRISTVGNLRVQVYKFGSNPLIIEHDKLLLPTGYYIYIYYFILIKFI